MYDFMRLRVGSLLLTILADRIEDSNHYNLLIAPKKSSACQVRRNCQLATSAREWCFAFVFLCLLLSFRSYSPTPRSCSLHLLRWKSLHRQVGIVTSCTYGLLYPLLKVLSLLLAGWAYALGPVKQARSVFVWVDASRPVRCNRDKSQEFLT